MEMERRERGADRLYKVIWCVFFKLKLNARDSKLTNKKVGSEEFSSNLAHYWYC